MTSRGGPSWRYAAQLCVRCTGGHHRCIASPRLKPGLAGLSWRGAAFSCDAGPSNPHAGARPMAVLSVSHGTYGLYLAVGSRFTRLLPTAVRSGDVLGVDAEGGYGGERLVKE